MEQKAQAQASAQPGLLCKTSIHTHDLVIGFIQQAADFAVPFQHVSWDLRASGIFLCTPMQGQMGQGMPKAERLAQPELHMC